MSNHLHLLLVDADSQLSSFMELFLGTLAKAVNVLRNRRGHVFERRFSAEPILDPQALKERWLYLVLNPVRAGLVARHEQWPGISLFSAEATPVRSLFRRFHKDRYEAARRATPKEQEGPSPMLFYEEWTVTIAPLPAAARKAVCEKPGRTLLEELRLLEGRTAEERQRRKQAFLGPKQVLAQRPFDAPTQPKRSPRPLCHTVISALREQYRTLVRALHQSYAEASAAYRAGQFKTPFPRYTYRPPVPILASG